MNNSKQILIDSSLSFSNYNINENVNENRINKNETNPKTKSSKKTVTFIDKVTYIDVECWKKYNLEQTADENFDDYLQELENKKNKKKPQSKKENVTCTCNII